ncbi:GNAT family N-acetyltransferase [Solimonas marina]|uniref:GNAT family N-acetyltransferase n=1 Tax=Solimonas marina TaxID=2714601 RepID=A0A969WD15_9GAMM|nr:GNAT family N-acetyltransferase [Solimonas marina]NKF23845.1 GNAT family N-acetyltransferase [Solimonas marina]
MSIEIRSAEVTDAAAVARLSGMFGYAPDVAAHSERLVRLLSRADHAVWVAEAEGRIAGWLHACQQLALESGGFAEILGLVVDEQLRSHGIGAALLRTAEQWAGTQGQRSIRVRSNTARERAHQFYLREGYVATKRQQVFSKTL